MIRCQGFVCDETIMGTKYHKSDNHDKLVFPPLLLEAKQRPLLVCVGEERCFVLLCEMIANSSNSMIFS